MDPQTTQQKLSQTTAFSVLKYSFSLLTLLVCFKKLLVFKTLRILILRELKQQLSLTTIISRAVLTNFPPRGKLSKAPMITPRKLSPGSHISRLVNQGIEKLQPSKICHPKTPLKIFRRRASALPLPRLIRPWLSVYRKQNYLDRSFTLNQSSTLLRLALHLVAHLNCLLQYVIVHSMGYLLTNICVCH